MQQLAHGIKVPITADAVESPIVNYGGGMTSIQFPTDDERWGRITFERLDSIKVSRGEFPPFPQGEGEGKSFNWVTTISNSAWLRERYDYEKRHYGESYNFGGNVDEMLTDFSHYVFSFHDEFVEAIAAGIWFESDDSMLGTKELQPDHPLRGLRNIIPSERFEAYGITCQVRRNPLSESELEDRARFCSQTILEVAAELDGHIGTDWSLTRRVLGGIGKTYLRSYFGNPVAKYVEVPAFSTIRLHIDKWLVGVHERRRKMGKT